MSLSITYKNGWVSINTPRRISGDPRMYANRKHETTVIIVGPTALQTKLYVRDGSVTSNNRLTFLTLPTLAIAVGL